MAYKALSASLSAVFLLFEELKVWPKSDLWIFFNDPTGVPNSSEVLKTLLLQHEEDPVNRYICQGTYKYFCFFVFFLVQKMADKANNWNQKVTFAASECSVDENYVCVMMLILIEINSRFENIFWQNGQKKSTPGFGLSS